MKKSLLLFLLSITLLKSNVTAQYWSALGKGIGLQPWQYQQLGDVGGLTGYSGPYTGPTIASLCSYKGELYVAGSKTSNGPNKNITKWNGSEWLEMEFGVHGYNESWINALLVHNDELYAAGIFDHAGNIEARDIAKWDGNNWEPVGNNQTYIDYNGYEISSLVIFRGELYAGGNFDKIGGVPAKNIAKWDGNNWEAVGTGIDIYGDPYNNTVTSMAVYQGELYVGGHFDTSGINPKSHILKWNGANWSAVGNGIDSMIFSLAVFDNNLFAGGMFEGTRKWDGNNWSSLNSDVNGQVFDLFADSNYLYAGGHFAFASGKFVNNIARWDGNEWHALSDGISNGIYGGGSSVSCLTIFNDNLFAGGNFYMAGKVYANQIAKWTETCFTPPSKPENIGLSSSCSNPYAEYFVEPVLNASDYTWTLPAGWSGISVTNRISVNRGTDPGILTIKANNPCGSSEAQTIAVSATDRIPLFTGNIEGKQFVCPNSLQTYSIPAASYASSYSWVLPNGWTGHSTSNTITVKTSSSGGTISVKAKNSCGESDIRILDVSMDILYGQSPIDIFGNIYVNTGQTISYYINAALAVNGFDWFLSGGGSITNIRGQLNDSINISWNTIGTYILKAQYTNECGMNNYKSIVINVELPGNDEDYRLKIIPNPSNGQFFVKGIKLQDKNISIEVINMAGQIIHRSTKSQGTNDYTQFVDLKKIMKGVYVIKIVVGNKIYTRKIVLH